MRRIRHLRSGIAKRRTVCRTFRAFTSVLKDRFASRAGAASTSGPAARSPSCAHWSRGAGRRRDQGNCADGRGCDPTGGLASVNVAVPALLSPLVALFLRFRSGQVSLDEAEQFLAQSKCQRRYAPMVFESIPEYRSASLRNKRSASPESPSSYLNRSILGAIRE
jgi:hypothetical protein